MVRTGPTKLCFPSCRSCCILTGITQASVCLQLAKDEAKLSAAESEPPLHPDIMPTIFINTGIDLEEQQYVALAVYLLFSLPSYRRRLHEAIKLGPTTDTQQAQVQEHSNLLMQHIEAWQQIQVLFMPGMSTLRNEWPELMN